MACVNTRLLRSATRALVTGTLIALVVGLFAAVPAQAAPRAEKWKGHPGRTIKHYTVRSGDTPSGIATRFHAWTKELYKINHKRPSSTWYVGERILVPVVTKRAAKDAKPAPKKPAHKKAAHKKAAHKKAAPKKAAPKKAAHKKQHQKHPKKAHPSRNQTTPTKQQVRRQIIKSAKHNGIDPNLALAIAWQESGWQMDVTSSAGAVGAMQVMPANVPWLQIVLNRKIKLTKLRDNVASGMTILRLLRLHNGVRRSIAAYYQGIGSLTINGPYKSTKRYVKSVRAIKKRLDGGWHPLAPKN